MLELDLPQAIECCNVDSSYLWPSPGLGLLWLHGSAYPASSSSRGYPEDHWKGEKFLVFLLKNWTCYTNTEIK